MFPTQRPRRLRKNAAVRNLVRENSVELSDLIYPMFINQAISAEKPVEAMPGVSEHTLETGLREATRLFERGVRSFILFGVPANKDDRGSAAYDENGIVQQAVRRMKKEIPDAVIFGG